MEQLLRIEGLVHGGDGLARADGQVVFVPYVAPGDLVRLRIGPTRGGAVRGEVLEVVERGAARVEPACPHATLCGGCDWQQVDLAAQQQAKAQAVRDTLARIGGLATDVVQPLVPSPKPTRYRRRLRAHLAREGWGFSMRGSNEIVPLDACLLVEEPVERLTGEIARALRQVKGFGAITSFGVDATEEGKGALHLELAQAPAPGVRARAEKLLELVPKLAGVVITGEKATPVVVGNPVLVDTGHRRLRVRPDLFAQANRLGARLLAEHAARTVEEGASVLELFAGAGTLTLALAERAGSLVATEGDGPALELARKSLEENGKSARFLAGPAMRVIQGIVADPARFDHVVLDPPRTGAKDVVAPIAQLSPKRITYVSCDAPTFARDAAQLVRSGYRLLEVTPYDLFPHTHHVELVALFER